jgi:hypothetical protein
MSDGICDFRFAICDLTALSRNSAVGHTGGQLTGLWRSGSSAQFNRRPPSIALPCDSGTGINNLLSFTNDLEARFFQGTDRGLMVDTRQLWHELSNRDDFARDLGAESSRQFRPSFQVFANRVTDILQGFLAGGSLAGTARQFITPHGESLFGFDQCCRVVHVITLGCCVHRSSRNSSAL